MSLAIEDWRAFAAETSAIKTAISRTKSDRISATGLLTAIEGLSSDYIGRIHPILVSIGIPQAEALHTAFQRLLYLSQGRNRTDSFKACFKAIRPAMLAVTLALTSGNSSKSKGPLPTPGIEAAILETLSDLVPSAALSYQQAVADLADTRRQSFRGPATELREALRETLDTLAPDEEVMKSDGFKPEPDKRKPTMRQKVNFILKSRGRRANEIATPQDAVSSIEGMIGLFARSVYNHGSIGTHVATSRQDVNRLKRYVDVVFADLLELD